MVVRAGVSHLAGATVRQRRATPRTAKAALRAPFGPVLTGPVVTALASYHRLGVDDDSSWAETKAWAIQGGYPERVARFFAGGGLA